MIRRSDPGEKLLSWAGRVPFGQKIIGIVVAPLVILGFTMAWWVSSELGGWLSYLLSDELVAQAMSVGMRGVVTITLAAALCGLLVAWFLIWLLTRPIRHITRVAQQVEKGDDTVRAKVWARDEIGELGNTFNAMIESLAGSRQALEISNEQLRRRNHELAVLYELAHMASQQLDAEQILRHGLNITLSLSGLSAGRIMLLDPDQSLSIRVQQNLPDSLVEAPALIDLAARGIANDAPLFIADVRTEPSLPPDFVEKCGAANFRVCVCLPISTKGKPLGVLSALGNHGATLNAAQITLLETICTQLAIAIENSRLWEELSQKERVRAQLLNKVVAAQEEERRRISRELHDETGQSLTSLLVQLKVLERADDPEKMRQHARELRELTAQTLEEVRRLSVDLRPAALDDLGLVPALEWYVAEYSRKVGIKTEFKAVDLGHPGNVRLPHEAEVIVYRVVQEALSNVARHSRATRAWVEIEQVGEMITVSVQDNGRGFDVEATLHSPNRGLGLLGMQERMELIGGRLSLASTPGTGTRVSIEVRPVAERIP